MKVDKSLGGMIAHQQLTSSQKISIPPLQLEMKKRKQWGEEHTISKPSMWAFFDTYRIVSVRSISHFELLSFTVQLSYNFISTFFQLSYKLFTNFLQLFYNFCQAQPQPQLQLQLGAEMVIISFCPATHPPTTPPSQTSLILAYIDLGLQSKVVSLTGQTL